MRTRREYEALLSNPNVQRGLAVIRATEGTARYSDPYSVAFGGRQFNPNQGHPGTSYPFSTKSGRRQRTTAHGAYQFLNRTWNSVANRLGLKDMSKQNQDVAALALIDGRGGLDALVKGDMKTFVQKAGPEWASLPTAPKSYDQPTKDWGFVEEVWQSAAPEPVDRVQLAALPVPDSRPTLQDQLGYEPGGLLAGTAGDALNPVSSAQASEMQPPKAVTNAAAGAAMTGSLLAPTPVSEVSEPTSLLDQKGGMPILQPQMAAQTPIEAPTELEQYQREFDEKIAANPESFATDEEYIMNQPVAVDVANLTPQQVAPLPAPKQVPSVPVAQPVQVTQPAPQAPPANFPTAPSVPSAMDVWNGQAHFGVDNTSQYGLTRTPGGNVHRYSEKYDRTDILNPDGSYRGQVQGRIENPAEYEQSGFKVEMPDFRSGGGLRENLGSMAGGLAGSLMGPIGGLLGAALGKQAVGGLLAPQQVNVFGSGFPSAPATPAQTDARYDPTWNRDDASNVGFSDAVVDAAFSGRGGLF